jgi:dUTP pyrophosphatase
MNHVIVQLVKLSPEVPTPEYGTSMSACFDLTFQPCGAFSIRGYDKWNRDADRMTYNKCVEILPGDRLLVPTGLIMKIKSGPVHDDTVETIPFHNHSIRLHARSGMALKKGLVLANAEGVIDVDYQKQIFVMLTNISAVPAVIVEGERIAQGEIVRNLIAAFELVDSVTNHSERDGGFGSTG